MLIRIITLVFLILMVACVPKEEEPQLRIGTNIWPGYAPLYLARHLGHYDKSSIKLVELMSASDVMRAIKAGALEGGALTLDEALTLVDIGVNLKIVLIMDFSNGGDVLLVKPEINSLDELKGKTIAVERIAVGAILLDGALSKANLKISDIKVIGCEFNKHEQCYDDFDGVVTFEPLNSKLQNRGAKLLFDSRQIPQRIMDVLVINEDVISLNEPSIKKLIAGYFKARDFMQTNPSKAYSLMGERLQLDNSDLIQAFSLLKLPDLAENHNLLGAKSHFESRVVELSDFMYENEFLLNRIENTNLVDTKFLPEVNQ